MERYIFGYKLIKQSKYDNLKRSINDAKQKVEELSTNLQKITKQASNASIHLDFDETFEHVTPIIAFNKENVEKLVELRYLQYSQIEDKFAIQLALVMMAEEVLQQIVDSFSEEKEDA